MPTKIEISYKTIIFTVFFLLFLWFLFLVREVILLIFVSFIIMSALNPVTAFFEKFFIPKILSVLIVYLALIIFLVFIGSSIVPSFVSQSANLGESLSYYLSTLIPFLNINIQVFIQQVAPLGKNFLQVTFGIFNNILGLFTIIVVSFYLVIERDKLESNLSNFMGISGTKRLLKIVSKIENRLGAWVRGELGLMAIIGFLTFIGLQLLHIPYALPLAIIAGLLEIVPTVGPVLSAIPAILVALIISPLVALAVAALYFIIQQLENQLVVPIIMKKAVGLPPLVTLVSLMIGVKLAGLIGAVLGVPVVVTIETVVSEYLKLKEVR